MSWSAVHDAAVHGHRRLHRHRPPRPRLLRPVHQHRPPRAQGRRRRRHRHRARRPVHRGAAGPRPDDVAVLPKFTYHAASPGRWGGVGKAKAASADGCAVCIEELQEGAVVRMLPSCKHYFHASCVDVWLLSHATCPVCRASPRPEKVRLGVASMSPPLPELRPYGASPKGGETTRVHNAAASRSPSPVIRSPTHSELFLHACIANSVMSPSPFTD
ncbi:hypothetical protein ACQ4PT_067875 [Festuca glaucescens]